MKLRTYQFVRRVVTVEVVTVEVRDGRDAVRRASDCARDSFSRGYNVQRATRYGTARRTLIGTNTRTDE